MCGFVAIRGTTSHAELKAMAEAVAKRGPDDRGEWFSDSFSAVHHRLSIIGPDERGRQPMVVDGITVLFNGCIYNYRELKKQLEEDGVRFVSDTDTEVLPHLYRKFGMGMFSLLNGMFAIVLWDASEERLIAARDPFGEKPLFVCEQNGRIGLASTLDAFEQGDWSLTPDTGAVAELLTNMRLEAPQTLYREVSQLPPGCYAVAGRDGEMQLRRDHFLSEPDQPLDIAPEEIEGEVERLLDDAFAMRMVADRPVGIFLSGGVDSSLIAASLAWQFSQPLHTFSVRFTGGGNDFDESGYARQVADHVGAEHRVLEVSADAHQVLDELAAAFDQPVINTAALPTYLISRETKKHVDVALSGVGGDELFGGYPRYLGMRWHARLRRMPGRHLLASVTGAFGDSTSSRNRRGRLRRFAVGLELDEAEAYRQWTRAYNGSAADILAQPATPAPHRWDSLSAMEGGLSALLERYGPVNGAMAWDILTYLPDDLLAMGDRMSMAHALELRAPFLDSRILSLLLTLPAEKKVAGLPWQERLKVMLRRIAARRLPHDVIYRPKQGFMAPVKHWLRDELSGEIERLQSGGALAGLVRPEFIRTQWQAHRAGQDRSDILWGLLLLDRWMQRHRWKF